jgi:hypothetical protein
VDFAEYDDMMRRMVEIIVRMDAAIDELKGLNRQQVAINADVNTTLARLETLITRVFRGEGANGREA